MKFFIVNPLQGIKYYPLYYSATILYALRAREGNSANYLLQYFMPYGQGKGIRLTTCYSTLCPTGKGREFG